MAIQGARPDNRQVVPYLFVRNGDEAIRFYERALGAKVLYRSPMPTGHGIFAQLKVGESVIQIADESPDHKCDPFSASSPETLGGTSVILEMYVDDVDAAFKRAVDAGATPTMPPFDAFFGDRYGWIRDPFGHSWALATVKETVTPEQIDERVGQASGLSS